FGDHPPPLNPGAVRAGAGSRPMSSRTARWPSSRMLIASSRVSVIAPGCYRRPGGGGEPLSLSTCMRLRDGGMKSAPALLEEADVRRAPDDRVHAGERLRADE